MVIKVSSSSSQPLGPIRGAFSSISRVAWVAMAFFVVALAVVAVKALGGRRVQPRTPSRPFIPTTPPPEGVNQLKENLLNAAKAATGSQDGYSTILPSIIDILEKENGLAGMKEDEDLFVYQNYQGYPYALVAVLGGKEAFDKIPLGIIEVGQLYELRPSLSSYVRIDPEKMTHSIMQYSDPYERRVLAVRFRHKGTKKLMVDIFLCRDLKANRWYLNEERSPEDFSLGRGQAVHFIGRLRAGNHPLFELA